MKYKCSNCNKVLDNSETYEYRGEYSCEDCFDVVKANIDFERQQIIEEERHKTDRFRGLDLSDSAIGKANRKILKSDIEIAKKESNRLKGYES